MWSNYYLQNNYSYDLSTLDYYAYIIISFNDYVYDKAFNISNIDIFKLSDHFRVEKVKEILSNKSFNIILDHTLLLECDEHILMN